MSAKRSSKQAKGKKKGNSSSAKQNKPKTASKPKVVVQASSTPPKETKAPRAPKSTSATPDVSLPFSRQNYILLAIGVGIIILGFFLMSLDDFVDATEFSVSLYIAPIVVMAGFAEIIYAIMYRPKASSQTQDAGN